MDRGTFISRCPLPEHLPLVAELLDDPHPQVRVHARKALLETAQNAKYVDAVRREAMRLLADTRWRALEASCLGSGARGVRALRRCP